MRKHTYTGAMGNVWASLVSGLFFVVYGNAIGMTPFLWGVMSSISSFALAAQLVSAALAQRVGRRKLVWFVNALAARVLRLLAIGLSLSLFWLGSPRAAVALIALVCLGNLFGAMSAPPWMSWLADLIPERSHAGFWGRRAAWIDFAVGCSVIPAGLLVDRVPEAWKLPVVVGIFVVATAVGIVDLFIHCTLPEPPMGRPRDRRYLRHLLLPLRDRAFRPWLVFDGCWTFSMSLGGALSLVYFTEHLGIRNSLLAGSLVLTMIPIVAGILVGPKVGRLVDRIGSKPVLFWGHMLWALLPGLWLFATPHTAIVWLGIQGLINGTASRAATTAANKLVTRFPAPRDVAVYCATSSCTASLASGLGSLAAGIVLRLLRGWEMHVLGCTFIGFHVLFAVSLALRLLCASVLIKPIRDRRASAEPAPEPAAAGTPQVA